MMGMLLCRKRQIKFGDGITFPGGHIEKRESFIVSVIREVKEETGLDIQHPKICGIKWLEVSENKRYVVLLYKTNEYSSTLKSSDEGKVFWVKLNEVKSMKLAPIFDKMLQVFTDDNIQEHIRLEDDGK